MFLRDEAAFPHFFFVQSFIEWTRIPFQGLGTFREIWIFDLLLLSSSFLLSIFGFSSLFEKWCQQGKLYGFQFRLFTAGLFVIVLQAFKISPFREQIGMWPAGKNSKLGARFSPRSRRGKMSKRKRSLFRIPLSSTMNLNWGPRDGCFSIFDTGSGWLERKGQVRHIFLS